METGDEFDNGNASPVPPHEREWRHPAEVHAANRQRIAAEAAPPPVSRRTTGILAVIGAAGAAVLIGVAVPKGVPDGPDQAAVSASTEPAPGVPVAKGGARATAVEFADGWFVIRTRDAGAVTAGGTMSIVTADGSTHEARRAADITGMSLSVFASGAGADNCSFETAYDDTEFRYLLEGGSLSVIDRSRVRHAVRNSLPLDASAREIVPLHIDTTIDGPGVLVAFDDRPVGIVSVVDHRTVAVLLPGLDEIICGA
ncbi:MAG: hypothetical protein ACO36A_02945 [Ilumatobacteraceae bacterium]